MGFQALLTSHHAPESREQVLLRFTPRPLPAEIQPHFGVSTVPYSSYSLRETGLILALTEQHVQHDYARILSPPIKAAMILQIIKPSVMADSYYNNFCWEEHTGQFAHKDG